MGFLTSGGVFSSSRAYASAFRLVVKGQSAGISSLAGGQSMSSKVCTIIGTARSGISLTQVVIRSRMYCPLVHRVMASGTGQPSSNVSRRVSL